ncbi:MAG: class I SAM-dependent methyltransferase [Mangrovibacterium sp.]
MAERANPKQFKMFKKTRLLGFIPFFVLNPYRKAVFWRYQFANGFCAGKRVLDVPCGMGWGTSLLKSASERYGIDISEEAIRDANACYPGAATFAVGDMTKLDFVDNFFDVVICLEGIEHVPETVGDQFYQECKRVLKPSGKLVLSSPYPIVGEHSGNPYHIKEYKAEEIRTKLRENQFSILQEESRKVDNLIVTIFVAQA